MSGLSLDLGPDTDLGLPPTQSSTDPGPCHSQGMVGARMSLGLDSFTHTLHSHTHGKLATSPMRLSTQGHGPADLGLSPQALSLSPPAAGPGTFQRPRVDPRGICAPGIVLEPTADHSPVVLGVNLACPALSFWPARLALEKRER